MRKRIFTIFYMIFVISISFLFVGCDKNEKEPSQRLIISVSGDGYVDNNGNFEQEGFTCLKAIANDGSAFYKWSDGDTNDTKYIDNSTIDTNLTAYFKKCTIYTTSSGMKVRAFGENTIITDNSSSSTRIELSAAIIVNNNEYTIQGDWYQIKNGQLSSEPVSNYSFYNITSIYTVNDYEFVPKDTIDYLFVRFPSYPGTMPRVGNYTEVTINSNKLYPIKNNAKQISTQNGYSLYEYTIYTNTDASNKREDMYVYFGYNTDSGVEYRFLSEFYTYTEYSVQQRDFYYALNNKLIHIIVKHS